jgi:hypothetical protein
MLQSTSKLLSRSGWKVHEPLPLNPRESRQLLDILTKSFRRQLDREHGPLHSWEDKLRLPTLPLTKRRRSSNPAKAGPSTDRLIQSILHNPLLSHDPKQTSPLTARDPLEIFDDACAKGFMKTEYARACLKAKKQLIIESSVFSVREGMKSSGAGLKVLRWLTSSGMTKNLTFLNDDVFRQLLMEFLVAEDLQEAIWTWLETLAEAEMVFRANPGPVSKPGPSRTASHVLLSFVKVEAMDGVALDSAFAVMTRAHELATRLGCQRSLLLSSIRFLTHHGTLTPLTRLPPSPESFDSFTRLVTEMEQPLLLSRLLLAHPIKPDATYALKFLKETLFPEIESKTKPSVSRHHSSQIMHLGVETARHLLERERFTDASWVIAKLQKNFPEELGADHTKAVEQAKAEAASIELLSQLQIA